LTTRVIPLLRYPKNGLAKSWPRTGFINDHLPALGEKVTVVVCEQPSQRYTATVTKIDTEKHCYYAQIDA